MFIFIIYDGVLFTYIFIEEKKLKKNEGWVKFT